MRSSQKHSVQYKGSAVISVVLFSSYWTKQWTTGQCLLVRAVLGTKDMLYIMRCQQLPRSLVVHTMPTSLDRCRSVHKAISLHPHRHLAAAADRACSCGDKLLLRLVVTFDNDDVLQLQPGRKLLLDHAIASHSCLSSSNLETC